MASPRPETSDPWEGPEETVLWQPEDPDSEEELEEVDLDDTPRQHPDTFSRTLDFNDESLLSTPKKKPPERNLRAPTSSGSVSPIDAKTAKELDGPYVKNTYRHEFADDREEDEGKVVGSVHISSNAQVVPLVTDIEGVEVFSSPKSKPITPMKPSKFKGEVLTPQKAIEFMIRERQEMDSEYAILRKQNHELKSELEVRRRIFEEREQLSPQTPENKVAEQTARNSKEDMKWRLETERVKRENDELRQQLRDNEAKMRQHYESLLRKVASEAEGPKNYSPESSPDEVRLETSRHVVVKSKSEDTRVMSGARGRSRDLYEELPASLSPVAQQSAKIQLHTEISSSRLRRGSAEDLIPVRRFLWLGANIWKVPYSGGGYPERRMVRLRRETKPGPNARQVRIVNDDGSYDPAFDPGQRQLFIAYPLTLLWYAAGKPGDDTNFRELALNRDAHIIPGRN